MRADDKAVLQLCSHPVVSWDDAPAHAFGFGSFQMAAIRTGGNPPRCRLVFALLAFVPGRRRVACRARTSGRPRHRLEVGPAVCPGNGTTFALEAQTDHGQLAGGL